MKHLTHILTLAAGLVCGGLNAQNVQMFNSKTGLSNSGVRSLYEDSRHSVWVTTRNGLNRYDGVKMNVYRRDDNNPASLVQDESTCVLEYDRNHVLVGTGGGLQMYDYATDSFSDIPYLLRSGDTIEVRIVNVCRVRDKIIVCCAGYGHGELTDNGAGGFVVRRVIDYQTDGGDPIFLMEGDGADEVWFVNSSRQVFRKTADGIRQYENVEGALKLCRGTSNRIFAATLMDGVYAYDARLDRFVQETRPEQIGSPAAGVNPWTDGKLLLPTDGGGLKVVDEETGGVEPLTIRTNDFNLETSNVKDALTDAFGNTWVAIYGKGVLMKPQGHTAFEYVGPNSISKNTIGTSVVFNVAAAPDNRLLVAADNDGLYLLNADGTESTHWSCETHPGVPKSFTSMASWGEDAFLLGTYFDGLWKMRRGEFSRVTSDINLVFDIQPSTNPARYWVGTMGQGLYLYDAASGHTEHYGAEMVINPYIYSVAQKGDRLYVGTSDGLTVLRLSQTGAAEERVARMLRRSAVRHVAVSVDGTTIWAATNNGLAHIDSETFDVKMYHTEHGLPINSVASLIVDGQKLWMGTDFGLSCMDTQTETFTNFFADDGLQDNEFSRGAAVWLDGKIYMGGIGGLTYFTPNEVEEMRAGRQPYKLRLVDLQVGGHTVHKGDQSSGYEILAGVLDDCRHFEMGYKDNLFVVELCVDGAGSQHPLCEYSVNGAPWVNQGGDGSRLVFANMEPGKYDIRVRAKVQGGLSEECSFTVQIYPEWYASVWAKILYFIIFILLCWLAYKFARRQMRLRKIMRRNRQQRKINEMRMQFFMNISHEIRTPMTLILAPLEKLIGTDKEPERQRNYQLMRQNAKRIMRLINQMMDVRKIEQGRFLLTYRKVELVGFVQNIFDVFASNAQGREIQYEFQHDADRMTVYIDADNMDKVVMNLLSNAFKFTPDGGSIRLRLSQELVDNVPHFRIEVTDTGVGIKDEEKPHIFDRFYSGQHQNGYIGTGIGLNLTSMLVKLHKGNIEVKDNPDGAGTLFVVRVPVGDDSMVAKPLAPAMGTHALPESGSAFLPPDSAESASGSGLAARSVRPRTGLAVLVEDDMAIRQYVCDELSTPRDQALAGGLATGSAWVPLAVHCCANGQEALDYIVARGGKVDVVISDIMMPVMDGMTLCQKLKSNFNTNHIPVVLMTALGSDADRIAGLTNGADGYVSKPFNIDVLRTTVIQLLKTRQMLHGKYHGDRQREEGIEKKELESPDEHLMRRVMKVINENMSNPDLSVEIIADKVGISRVHFYRKMKDLTGQAPRDFVKYVRLKEAARLLSEKKMDITGVSVAIGFKSLSAFSTNFKSLYGLSPTEWVRRTESEREKGGE